MDLVRAGDPDEEPGLDDMESVNWRQFWIPFPSFFDPGRYRPLSPGSSRLAWVLGTGGLIIPFLSIAGAISGYHAARRGSHRAGGLAVVWCMLTASISIAFWGPLFLEGTWKEPTTYTLEATNLRTGVEPPPQLGFASVLPASSYAELDLEIRNRSNDPVPFSPSSIDVSDRTGSRLAWATDDDAFLTTSELPAKSTQRVNIWVALPAGRGVGSIQVGDSHVEVR